MLQQGFNRSDYDSCVYFKEYGEKKFIYLLLYVADMLVACLDKAKIKEVKTMLKQKFNMKKLGNAKKILGIEIARDRVECTLALSQRSYLEKVLQRFGMSQDKPVMTQLAQHFKLSLQDAPSTEVEQEYMEKVPYSSAVGSLMYSMVCTRPDLSHAVSLVSRYLGKPGKQHWEAVKWIYVIPEELWMWDCSMESTRAMNNVCKDLWIRIMLVIKTIGGLSLALYFRFLGAQSVGKLHSNM